MTLKYLNNDQLLAVIQDKKRERKKPQPKQEDKRTMEMLRAIIDATQNETNLSDPATFAIARAIEYLNKH